MKTILTGIRVNGEMTLGNFLGALLPMVRLANAHAKDYNINIFVPDLHTIISDVEGNIAENTKKSLKYFLAAGLTRAKISIFIASLASPPTPNSAGFWTASPLSANSPA